MTDTPTFPDITGSVLCCTGRGLALILTLTGIGEVKIAVRDLVSSRRFARAVFRQTGFEIPLMNDRV